MNTNIFEANTGAINIAPIKLSGQYKIVVGLDGSLKLDDYNGRTSKIDMTQRFLPQVANFLKTKTEIVSQDSIRYGAFQRSTRKYFHAPIYLSNSAACFPKYFTLSRALNEHITDANFLQKYGDIIKVMDFDKIGLTSIFAEVTEKLDYPVYFNWEASQLSIYGYSINDGVYGVKTVDITYNQANQNNFEVFNNSVMNRFVDAGLFFPRFLNIEFEFEYENEYQPFNNFHGFYALSEISAAEPPEAFDSNIFHIKLKEYNNRIEYSQIRYITEYAEESFIDYLTTLSVQHIYNQQPQQKYFVRNIAINDSIRIVHPNGDTYFEYIIKQADIVSVGTNAFLQTLVKICDNATKACGRDFIFSASVVNLSKKEHQIKIVSNLVDDTIESYTVEVPDYFIVQDRLDIATSKQFRQIADTDITLSNNTLALLDGVNNLIIEGNNYQIIEKFKYDGFIILRLDATITIEPSKPYYAQIFETKTSKLVSLLNIDWLLFNSDLKALPHFDQDAYSEDLKVLYPEAIDTINDFQTTLHINPVLPYVKESESNELIETDSIELSKNNDMSVLSMIFNNGIASSIAPNTLNFDKQFYKNNGNIDINIFDGDVSRFNWFLINGKCPEYLKNDVRSLRYFDKTNNETPRLTTRLQAINDKSVTGFCEAVFLGVKYQLPVRYADYQFAVYLNFQDELDININYKFEIDTTKKTIYLSVNKYLDFIDLIRGGKKNNEPVLDLSFFYAVTKSYNTNSEFLYGFKAGGILICEETMPVLFENELTNDWKIQKGTEHFVCLKRSANILTPDFTELFPEASGLDLEFYIYSEVTYAGTKYQYVAMTVTVSNIHSVKSDYVWCEDIKFKFFDTKGIFLQKYGDVTDGPNLDEILYVEKSNIISYQNESANVFGDYVQIATMFVNGQQETFKMLLPNKELSLKESWFSITKNITYSGNGTKQTSYESFIFPDFFLGPLSTEQLITKFDNGTFDETTSTSRITLFNRNQIWLTIRDLVASDAKFKYNTSQQIRTNINDLLVTNLREYSDYKAIESVIGDTFVKLSVIDSDVNVAVWNILEENKVYAINRFRGAYIPYLPTAANPLKFQVSDFQKNNTIWNMFDQSFGGVSNENPLSATGFWNQVQGNVVSTLYCKNQPIEIIFDFVDSVNYKEILANTFQVEDCIIAGNDNREYIRKIDANVNEYILSAYAEWLLNSMYSLTRVENELGQSLDYSIDQKNQFQLKFKSPSTYITNFKKIKLLFTRK